jgi:hypothetical protein
MFVPDNPPATCPACGDEYESVSRHADGFLVNLLDNERYRRVCFHPATAEGAPALDCYHHTHETSTRDAPRSDAMSRDVVDAADGPTDAVEPSDRS